MFFMHTLLLAHMRLARGNGLGSGDLTKALTMYKARVEMIRASALHKRHMFACEPAPVATTHEIVQHRHCERIAAQLLHSAESTPDPHALLVLPHTLL